MITGITIENFKGIRERVRLEVKPITLLFGPNSGGKSTILQAIHYAKEVIVNRRLNPSKTESGGDFVNLGGFKEFVHNKDVRRQITLRFEFNISPAAELGSTMEPMETLATPGNTFDDAIVAAVDGMQSAWVEFCIAWDAVAGELYVACYRVGVEGVEIGQVSYKSHGAGVLTVHPEHPFFRVLSKLESVEGDVALQLVLRELTEIPGHPKEYNLALERDALPSLHGQLNLNLSSQLSLLLKLSSPLSLLLRSPLEFEQHRRFEKMIALIFAAAIVSPLSYLKRARSEKRGARSEE